MGPLSRALVALLSVCLISGPLFPLMVPARNVTDFEGTSPVDILFEDAGEEIVNITIPRPFSALSAEMNISGRPTTPGGTLFPRNVSIDVGNDSQLEWAFDGPGHGPLGRQDRFSDGKTSTELWIDGPTGKKYELQLPKDAEILDAGLTVAGVPTPTQRLVQLMINESLNASKTRGHVIQGIKDTDIALNSSVALSDPVVVENKVDVVQTNSSNWYLLSTTAKTGQSFKINKTDPRQDFTDLYSVDIGFGAVSTSGISVFLYLYNTTSGADYKPVGVYFASSTAHESNISNNYVHFDFNPPYRLRTDQVYSMSVDFSGGNMPTVVYHERVGGNNANSMYRVPGCYMHVSTDMGMTWTANHERDWQFKTHVGIARPATALEKGNLLVDGQQASKTIGNFLYYNWTPRYGPEGWNFTVKNGNALETIYNLSGFLDFNDAPDHVAVDIGADSVYEYTNNGNMTTSVVLAGLKSVVIAAVNTALGLGKVHTDVFGNELVNVSINVTGRGKGRVVVRDLFVLYNHTETMNGLRDAVISYSASQGGTGALKVPLRVRSSSAGVVRLSGLLFVYDGPPQQVKAFPTGLAVPEEGTNASLLDLTAYFVDDMDGDLVLAVHNVTTSTTPTGPINVSFAPTGRLSVDVRKAINWSGDISIIVNASDDLHFVTESEPFNVTIRPVNDAPVITSVPPGKATVGKEYRYNFTFDDSDSYSVVMWLEKAPVSMVLSKKDRSICWTPGPADVGNHDLKLNIYDGFVNVSQNISITVNKTGGGGGGAGNKVPGVQPMANRTIEVGSDLNYQVPASDPDLDALFYYLISGPNGLTINNTTGMISWKPEAAGNFTVGIRISDGFLWVDATLNISVVPKGSTTGKPTVTIERPYSGENATGILTMMGKATAKGTTLAKVEYSIDGGPWMNADLQSDGSWSAETNIKNLTKGNHTLVVRATDIMGQTALKYTSFTVKGKGGTRQSGISLMSVLPYLFLILLIVAGGVGIAAAASSKKGKRKVQPSKKGEPKDTKAAAPHAEAEKTSIESAFLVYHDGRLITYHSQSEIEDLDATLQVIKDFVKASFRGDVGRLDSLRYENMNIILERGVQMYLVVITPEEDSVVHQSLRKRMRSFLGDVHERYRHILKVWDGKYKSVKPIEKMVGDYVDGKWVPGAGKVAKEEPAEEKEPPKEEPSSKRWDESPDVDSKDLSKVEKQKLLHDRLTRGEITEEEFEKLKSKL